ncbi:peptidoglycan recognition protein family protein [Citricoccus muralis]|uniref:peptidoglycan recognition protein family protein n=1 Tax=Citricoccus muralis TaxID=169134 RepID=UPI001472D389|nr:N-acetylmuramoyl-L-alanine amidase [Citricoccus muralis]
MTDHIIAPVPTPAPAFAPAPTTATAAVAAAAASAPVPSRPARLSRRRLLQGTAALGGVIAFGTAVSASSTPAFAATVSQPDIISTNDWGASAPQGSLPTLTRRPTHLVIHHTTHVNSDDFSVAAAEEVARLIQRNHMTNGWADTGQQFTIARGGQMLEGRHGSLDAVVDGTRFIEGAHAYGFNDQSVGIEVDGMYTNDVPTDAQWSSLVHLSAFICQRYGLDVDRIIAHRDVPGAQTLCCGDAFYGKLSALRDEVASALANGVDGGSGASGDYPTVRLGDEGDAVRRVQVTLDVIGHDPGAADGVFGPATEKALREYQSSLGTGVDGIAGPRTWGALATHHAAGSTVSSGDSGTEVEYLQRGLKASSGVDLATDGHFGDQTEAAVSAYQKARGLTVDGVAGGKTWAALKHAQ